MGYLLGSPYGKDYSIWGIYIGAHIYGNYHTSACRTMRIDRGVNLSNYLEGGVYLSKSSSIFERWLGAYPAEALQDNKPLPLSRDYKWDPILRPLKGQGLLIMGLHENLNAK